MSEVLKKCPFCGSGELRKVRLAKISYELNTFEMPVSHIECLRCGSDGPKIAYVDDVVNAWNLRMNDE